MVLFRRHALKGSGVITDDKLGSVTYVVRANARRIIARWRGPELRITVPDGMDESEVRDALSRMASRLQAVKPAECIYRAGQTFDFGDFRVGITRGAHRSGCRITARSAREFGIAVPAYGQLPEKAVSDAMKKIAGYLAPVLLLPRVRELAAETGCRPARLSVSSGRRVLGHCNSHGDVAVSSVVLFLPYDLRDYIIYHELAHLSEMNHSAAFHQICDRYCGGRERHYIARLRAFRFPVL